MKRLTMICMLPLLCGICGCRSGVSTQNIPPVENFNVSRYMGVWYEIARLPHRFEDGLTDVSANYYLMSNGKVKVVNRGRDPEGQITEITGSAEMARRSDVGILKVMFFWPFSSEYRIIMLDENYRNAMVTSSTTDYLWILSRDPHMDQALLCSMVEQAAEFGFDTANLIFTEQEEKR